MYESRIDLLVFPNDLSQVSNVVSLKLSSGSSRLPFRGVTDVFLGWIRNRGMREMERFADDGHRSQARNDAQYVVLIMSTSGSRAFEFEYRSAT